MTIHAERFAGLTLCARLAVPADVGHEMWRDEPRLLLRVDCIACRDHLIALADVVDTLRPHAPSVSVVDVDHLRLQICDRVHQHVLTRVAAIERDPGLVDVTRQRRAGALAELRLLLTELLPSVRAVGGFAPTEEELAALAAWLNGETGSVAEIVPALRRLVAAYRDT